MNWLEAELEESRRYEGPRSDYAEQEIARIRRRRSWRVGDLVQATNGAWWRIESFPLGVDGYVISVDAGSVSGICFQRVHQQSDFVAHVSMRRVSR